MTTPTPDPRASILDSTKKALNLAADYDVFDPELIMHINSVFVTLTQLGIGPATGYMIEGSEDEWSAFLGSDPLLNSVKTYMYLRVRLLFDPPAAGYTQTAMQEQVKEMEWRLNVYREGNDWVDPNPPSTTVDTAGADFVIETF